MEKITKLSYRLCQIFNNGSDYKKLFNYIGLISYTSDVGCYLDGCSLIFNINNKLLCFDSLKCISFGNINIVYYFNKNSTSNDLNYSGMIYCSGGTTCLK